jgi:hypothetical protein
MKLPPLALANLLLASAILAVGLPSIVADFRRLPAEVTVGAAERGAAIDEDEIEGALSSLESATSTSAATREDLALMLLAGGSGPVAMARAARAADELRTYLAEVPGDSRGWAALAEAELMQGHRVVARDALKMSILTSPWSASLVLWRCDLGIDIYAALDDEARGLLKEQFRVAAERSPRLLGHLVWRKKAALIARIMLAGNPEDLAAFESGFGP